MLLFNKIQTKKAVEYSTALIGFPLGKKKSDMLLLSPIQGNPPKHNTMLCLNTQQIQS